MAERGSAQDPSLREFVVGHVVRCSIVLSLPPFSFVCFQSFFSCWRGDIQSFQFNLSSGSSALEFARQYVWGQPGFVPELKMVYRARSGHGCLY